VIQSVRTQRIWNLRGDVPCASPFVVSGASAHLGDRPHAIQEYDTWMIQHTDYLVTTARLVLVR